MYENSPETNELMHYGVPGMKWGVRKSYKEIQKLQRSSARKIRSVMRIKNLLNMQMKYRKDTAKLNELAQNRRARGMIARSKMYETLAKVTNPTRTIANKRITHLEKQISNNMSKVSKMTLENSEVYINIGQDYLTKLEKELDRRKGIAV